jgi:hypothetical protein
MLPECSIEFVSLPFHGTHYVAIEDSISTVVSQIEEEGFIVMPEPMTACEPGRGKYVDKEALGLQEIVHVQEYLILPGADMLGGACVDEYVERAEEVCDR